MKYINDRYYYEVLAKFILQNVVDDKYSNLHVIDTEKPDLQSDTLDIGIEVTCAKSPQDGQCDKIAFENFGKGKTCEEIEQNICSDYKTFEGELKNYNGILIMSPTKGMISIDAKIELLKNAIIKKTKFLNDKYKIFNENALFVFPQNILDKNEIIQGYSNAINSIKIYKYHFQKIYIFCQFDCSLICFNNTDDINIFEIKNFKAIKKNTLSYNDI